MAYELKRAAKSTCAVKIGEKEIPIQIDIGKRNNDFNKRYADLVNAEIELKRVVSLKGATPEDLNAAQLAYGMTVISIMQLVFGEAGASEIIEFFDGNYAELLNAIVPFFLYELIPELNRIRNEHLKSYQPGKNAHKRRFFK